MAAFPERGEGASSQDREHRTQDVRGGGHGCSVRACIRYDEKNVLDTSVADLQRQPPQQGLHIVEPRLRVDRQALMSGRRLDEPGDPGVPSPKVTRDRKGDLVPDREIRIQPRHEATQKPCLGGIPDRVWTWIRPHADIEPDDRAETNELADARPRYKSTLDAHHVRG